ncbi:MAG: pyridoxal phosphate-dependent aminotransferase [Candidatus Thorarchaeota archaeon]
MRFRTEHIMPPPIVELLEVAKSWAQRDDFLNLGQGTAGYIPCRDALRALAEQIWNPRLHTYTPDQGLIELREEVALYVRRTHGFDADPQTEIVITAGGNQAFAGAVLMLVGPGENVIVPEPYYFNSVMAIELTGGVARSVPVGPNLQPSAEAIGSAVDKKTRAVLLVSPNNPTGAVYSQHVVDEIVDLCLENDLMLISDETYARLVFEGARHYSPRSRRDAEDNVISIGSFSKDLGMAGWRVGFLVGSESFVSEYMKVQDTVAICASTAGQILALEALKREGQFVDRELARFVRLRDIAYSRMMEIDALEPVRTHGTFYLFPAVRGCTDSRKLALDLLKEESVFVLPGSVFGSTGEGYIRISIGPLTPDAVEEAFDRIGRFFSRR